MYRDQQISMGEKRLWSGHLICPHAQHDIILGDLAKQEHSKLGIFSFFLPDKVFLKIVIIA